MDFSEALEALKDHHMVQRTGWNGKGMYVALQRPDEGSKMGLPYLYMKTAQGDLVPWLASQTDLLAEDWERLVDVREDETQKPGAPVRTLKWNDEFRFVYRSQEENEDVSESMEATYRVVAPHADLVKPEAIAANLPFFLDQKTGEVYQVDEDDRVEVVS